MARRASGFGPSVAALISTVTVFSFAGAIAIFLAGKRLRRGAPPA